MITGISHIVMGVRNFEACRETYGGKLGLREVSYGAGPKGHRVCAWAVGPSFLELHEDPEAKPARDPETGEAINSMFDNRCWVSHFAFPVVDAVTRYDEFAARGIDWTVPPSDQPVGLHLIRRRLLQFDDPELLTVQMAEPIDDAGEPLPPLYPDVGGEPWPGCNRFDHIMVNTPDMEAKRAFYVGTLGLKGSAPESTTLGEQSDLNAGKTVVELIWKPAIHAPLHAGTVTQIGFAVADIRHAYEELTARGVEASPPVEVAPLPGIRRRAIPLTDPDGLGVQLVQLMQSP
jgi:catechol 2,3-dioxygenase-like lactoylglutathione lyase family enzyme